jgi:hypothetical protein
LLLAVSAVGETLRRTRVPFNLGIWGSIFPLGVWAACACVLAKVAHSRAFAAIGAAAVVVHVLFWLVVVVLTAQRAYRGELFHAPCLQSRGQAAGAAAAAGGGGAAAGALPGGGMDERRAHAASKVEDRLLRSPTG